jgi:aerobic-type carbon monoxide dehydrogenase small subunit (CoxS/CutS family)
MKELFNVYSHPTEKRMRDYPFGNLRRCGTYKEVLAAVAKLAMR